MPSNIIEAKSSDYSIELVSKDAAGHPTYSLRRLRDNVVVATIRRYEGSKSYRAGGRNPRGYLRSGARRTFWQWSFERDRIPAMHRGRTSYYVESRAACIRDAIWFLEN